MQNQLWHVTLMTMNFLVFPSEEVYFSQRLYKVGKKKPCNTSLNSSEISQSVVKASDGE